MTIVTYNYTVKNTGNLTVTDIVVSDSLIGPITLVETALAPGDQTTGVGYYQATRSDFINEYVTNTATIYNGSTPLNQTQATITAI